MLRKGAVALCSLKLFLRLLQSEEQRSPGSDFRGPFLCLSSKNPSSASVRPSRRVNRATEHSTLLCQRSIKAVDRASGSLEPSKQLTTNSPPMSTKEESLLAPVLRVANDIRRHFHDVMKVPFFAWSLLYIPLAVVLFYSINVSHRVNRLWLRLSRPELMDGFNAKEEKIVAFFHPYCDMGGGGERVLWAMIETILHNESLRTRYRIAIYTASAADKTSILRGVKQTFGIDLLSEEHSSRVHFLHIRSCTLLDARWYPVATMAGQCLGSLLVGLECFLRLVPDTLVDTMGAPFIYPVFYMLHPLVRVVAYVHYPLISADMLALVREQRPSYNNSSSISKNTTVSSAKLLYYRFVAFCYGLAGRCVGVAYANSSWTEGHMASMWHLTKMSTTSPTHTPSSAGSAGAVDSQKKKEKKIEDMSVEELSADLNNCIAEIRDQFAKEGAAIPADIAETLELNRLHIRAQKEELDAANGIRYIRKLFPPSNTTALANISLETPRDGRLLGESKATSYILSVGQFRPEKDHSLQLVAFAQLLKADASKGAERHKNVELVMLGSTRNSDDEKLVHLLRAQATELGVASRVRFVINAPYAELQTWLAAASVGLHTMWNEHFGISVVEMMAAGIVVVAHNSGGPQSDIVTPSQGEKDAKYTGYLATTAEEYADCLGRALDDGVSAATDTGADDSSSSAASNNVRVRARASVRNRFSDEAFSQRVLDDFTLFL